MGVGEKFLGLGRGGFWDRANGAHRLRPPAMVGGVTEGSRRRDLSECMKARGTTSRRGRPGLMLCKCFSEYRDGGTNSEPCTASDYKPKRSQTNGLTATPTPLHSVVTCIELSFCFPRWLNQLTMLTHHYPSQRPLYHAQYVLPRAIIRQPPCITTTSKRKGSEYHDSGTRLSRLQHSRFRFWAFRFGCAGCPLPTSQLC